MKNIYLSKRKFKEKIPLNKKIFLLCIDLDNVKPYLHLLLSMKLDVVGFITRSQLLDGYKIYIGTGGGRSYQIYSIENFKTTFAGEFDNCCIVDVSQVWEYRPNKIQLKKHGITCDYFSYDITNNKLKHYFASNLLNLVSDNNSLINRTVIKFRKKDIGFGHFVFHQQKALESLLHFEYLESSQYENNQHCQNDLYYILKLFFLKIKVLFSHRLLIPQMVVCPGTRCTLKCKHCSQLFSYFPFSNECKGIHGDFDPELILSDIDKLLSVVKYIGVLLLVGGESFINSSMPKLMEKVVSERRIKGVVLITNGTVLPNKNLIPYLKHPKVVVKLSEYPLEVTKNRNKVINFLFDNKINTSINFRSEWNLPLDFSKRNTKEKVFEMTKCCYDLSYCVDMFMGKIFPCERMAAANAMHFIPDDVKDYVDVRRLAGNDLKDALIKFQHSTYFPCCERCGFGKKIPPAEQLEKGKKLNYPIVEQCE